MIWYKKSLHNGNKKKNKQDKNTHKEQKQQKQIEKERRRRRINLIRRNVEGDRWPRNKQMKKKKTRSEEEKQSTEDDEPCKSDESNSGASEEDWPDADMCEYAYVNVNAGHMCVYAYVVLYIRSQLPEWGRWACFGSIPVASQ